MTDHEIDVEVAKIAKEDGWALPDANLIEFGRKVWLRRLGASGVPQNDLQRRLIGNLLTRWELMTNDFKSVVDEQERDFFAAMYELVKAVDAGNFWTAGASGVDVELAQDCIDVIGSLWALNSQRDDQLRHWAIHAADNKYAKACYVLLKLRKHIAQAAAPEEKS